MTLVVETPDGIVTGASVLEVNATYCPNGCGLAGDIVGSLNSRGEAVAVEVLPGQWLFALIGEPGELIYRARPDLFGDIRRSDWARLIPDEIEPVELIGDVRPRLVTFEVINDPRTAQQIDPDDLAAIFGEGVRLLRVTLEVTRDDITFDGIDELIPSLGDFRGDRLLDGFDSFDFSFATTLRTRHFIWR